MQKTYCWDKKWIWCFILQGAFSIYSIWQMNLWLCKNCRNTQELENRRDLYTSAFGLFNYDIKVKCKCLYQFLINLTLSISTQQISEVLKQRHRWIYNFNLKYNWLSNHSMVLFYHLLGDTDRLLLLICDSFWDHKKFCCYLHAFVILKKLGSNVW